MSTTQQSRRNRRVRTGIIRARALDLRHIYTTHTVALYEAGVVRFGNLDTYPDRAEVVE